MVAPSVFLVPCSIVTGSGVLNGKYKMTPSKAITGPSVSLFCLINEKRMFLASTWGSKKTWYW